MIIDLLFLLVAGFGFFRGYNSGILRTVFWGLSILIGLFVAMRYSVPFSNALQRIFNVEHSFMFIAGFLLAFIISMFLIRMIARIIEKLLENLNINIINKLAGGVVFSTFTILIYSLILWFLVQANMISETKRSESFTYPFLETFPEQSRELIKKLEPVLRDFWQTSGEAMNKDQ